MATKPLPSPAPLDLLLAAIPSLPRPFLARLTARLIDRLDEVDGDPDLEPDDFDEDGHDDEAEPIDGDAFYGLDQREVWHTGASGAWRLA